MKKVIPPESEHREHWRHHPHTKELAQVAREEVKQRLVALLARARTSTDPDVRHSLAEYEAALATQELLEYE
jgi:hypothetical protein